MSSSNRFCCQCGHPTEVRVPPDDNRPRQVCAACGHIHYENPKIIVGCIPEHEGRILLCRRAIAPRIGFWTLPAGFLENGETSAEGARRETLEEAGADVTIDAAFALISIAHIDQAHIFYRGRLTEPTYAAGVESLEVALFSEAEIPWEEIAFPSVAYALEHFFSDRTRGRFGFHETDLKQRF